MNRFLTVAVVTAGLMCCGTARATDPKKGEIDVNKSGNGTNNTVEVNPSAGQKVVVKNSVNGTNNTLVVAPDPNGKVVIDASGKGKGDKIIVQEAPGEKVQVHGSGNVTIQKVPGPGPSKPLSGQQSNMAGSGHRGRR